MPADACPVCGFKLLDVDDECARCGRPVVELAPPTSSLRWVSWPMALAVLSIAATLGLAVSGRLVALLTALVGRG